MDFQNYGLRKTWLDESLKSLLSEQPLTVNMLKGTRRAFIRFLHQFEENCVVKGLS